MMEVFTPWKLGNNTNQTPRPANPQDCYRTFISTPLTLKYQVSKIN